MAQKNLKLSELPIHPVVCCTGAQYVICIPVLKEMMIRIRVGDQEYTCSDNGVIKTDIPVHQISIPVEQLDRCMSYTVLYAAVIARKPYRTEHSVFMEKTFPFRPVPDRCPIRIAHLSDVHGLGDQAVAAGSFFGSELDLLILNGDISSSSNSMEEVLLPLSIAFRLTAGSIPCIITRGNHDLRGIFAERLHEIYPTDNGNMYYYLNFTRFRILVLDCGEDKDDAHVEYGGTAAFHSYRLKETAFLSELTEKPEIQACDTPLIVLSHIPFPHTDGTGEFAIEQEVYTLWCDLIKSRLHPAFCLFGHHHQTRCFETGNEFDTKKIGCPIVLGGKPVSSGPKKNVVGAFITLYGNRADVAFADRHHIVSDLTVIEYPFSGRFI